MIRHPLGRSGMTVSALNLGGMSFSGFYGPADEAVSMNTLAAALDAGITFLDTANVYGTGHNEELLSRFLKTRRNEVTLATKFAIVGNMRSADRRIDNSPAHVAEACEASLKRLGVDVIDLYYCHRRNAETPLEDLIGAMSRLVEAGKVRALGLSEMSPDTLRRANAIHPIAAVQSEYSLWTRDPERGMLQACAELGVTFVAFSPLGRGFLTGTVDPAALADGDFRKANPRFQGDAVVANRRLVDRLIDFAKARGLTSGQVALAWIMNKNPGVIPLFGTRTPEHLAENVASVNVKLDAAELAALDDLFAPDAVQGDRYPEKGWLGVERY